MRLLFVTSGSDTYSNLDPNIVNGFKEIERLKRVEPFHFFYSMLSKNDDVQYQIKQNKPDVVLVLKRQLPADWIQSFNKHRIPIGLWVVDDPYLIKKHVLRGYHYDFILTQEINAPAFYEKRGMRAFYLPLAVNTSTYFPQEVESDYQSDICFVGSGMANRIRLLHQLGNCFVHETIRIIGRWWEPLQNQLGRNHFILNKPISAEEASKYYNGAKIVLNMHRNPYDSKHNPSRIQAATPNNRTFDIAACSAFQLTSYRKAISDFYQKDEIIEYQSVDDLVKKVEYYLVQSHERREIAKRAYKRTMNAHTYSVRLTDLIHLLKTKRLLS
ncbi:glycosyltransferase [Alkalihalobacillus sp. APA_J-10(15)]|nr:glycosyltransferase [Halalkalibacter sp. APA_J-10(15)]